MNAKAHRLDAFRPAARRRTDVPGAARPNRGAWRIASILLIAVVALVDRATGNQVSFSLFYVVPIVVAAWFTDRRTAAVVAALASALWIVDRYEASVPPILFYWNALAETAIFAGGGLTVGELRREFDRRALTAAELERAYRRLDEEMKLVGDLQRGLLPAAIPVVPGATLVAHYEPCERSGGDYFDFFALRGSRVGILIADASGHGAPAAVLMAMTRILLHTRDLDTLAPDAVLDHLQRDLAGNLPDGQFVTACYAVFDPRTRGLDYAVAGHNPPLLLRAATGEVLAFENPCGMPLGIAERNHFDTMHEQLGAGDAVLFYTDGLTEARNAAGAEFGEGEVCRLLRHAEGCGTDALLARVVEAHTRHMGAVPAADDTTVVLLQVDAVPAMRPAPPAKAMTDIGT